MGHQWRDEPRNVRTLGRGPVGSDLAVRTYDELWHTVGYVSGVFTEEECDNFRNAAKYETD